jgi:tRNA pseudouridine55 synthase
VNLDGIIVVDKPRGWTSHDVVNKMRGIAGTRRVGHLGTLDPLATGVLPVMVGQATRLAQFFDKADKTYEAVVRFGFATSSYDADGDPLGEATEIGLVSEHVEACLTSMRGEIMQTPPPVSAKKVGGVAAYKLARKNVSVELAPVKVTIYGLTLLAVDGARARLRVRCSAGTYVRTIAHELGRGLGCGAHVEELRRTQSGPFGIGQAKTLEALQQLKAEGRLADALLAGRDLLPEFPAVFVDDTTLGLIRQGRDFAVSPFRASAGAEHVKAIAPDGRLAAIGKIALPHVYHPMVVLG